MTYQSYKEELFLALNDYFNIKT